MVKTFNCCVICGERFSAEYVWNVPIICGDCEKNEDERKVLLEQIIQHVVREFDGIRIGRKNKIVLNDDVYKAVLEVEDFSPTGEEETEHYEFTDTGDKPWRWFKLVELR